MSSDLAIEAEGLGKRYVLGERGRVGLMRNREELWALRDATFRIERGQAVGVVGMNGAGKTTLLKILSRITVPTAGEARIRGSVGSLLEVGTGFHPELTGRDNVYLNGAILGMRRREIKAKFDEIVAFAEVERFIDTPVKRYSSGMYVRLAFAVAAHLEPDILIVDEVLAVGDQSFQRKCLGKMGEVSSEGRTVLFVSHNMAAIRSLTPRAIWLDHGRIAADGETEQVISDYLTTTAGPEEGLIDLSGERFRRGAKSTAGRVRFESLALLSPDGEPVSHVRQDSPLRFRVVFSVREPLRFLELYIRVKTPTGMWVFASFSDQHEAALAPGRYATTCTFEDHRLMPREYAVELIARGADPEDVVPSAMTFRVTSGQAEENPRYVGGGTGVVRVESTWTELERVVARLHEPIVG
jgi:homopolymeric O-antigen transport system ATP-binding protein